MNFPTKTTLTAVLTLTLTGTSSVSGQDVDACLALLEVSRTKSETFLSRNQFLRTRNRFCNEYEKSSSRDRSLNIDLKIAGIGAGGGSESTTNAVAVRYCGDSVDASRDDMDYRHYMESISPGAYQAYRDCNNAHAEGVQFEMLTPPTRDLLELVVFHRTSVPEATARMSYSHSSPVTCQWVTYGSGEDVERSPNQTLGPNERARVRCKREAFNTTPTSEPDFVNVIRDGGRAMINVPWGKYGTDNNPIPTLAEIRRSLELELSALRDGFRILVERRWHNLNGERNPDQDYVNDTGYPIEIAVTARASNVENTNDVINRCEVRVLVDGSSIVHQRLDADSRGGPAYWLCNAIGTIPPGATYRVTVTGEVSGRIVTRGQVSGWWELRASP